MTGSPSLPPAPDDPVDAAFAEYLRRVDADGRPDLEAFLREFPPDIREELLATIESEWTFEERVGSTDSSSRAGDGANDATQVGPNAEADQGVTRSWPNGPRGVAREMENHGRCIAGDYELLEQIGRGGMGVVYRAHQRSLDRIVAVKMILAGKLATADDIQRFQAEAQAAGKVDHPNIVTIHQVGECDGRHFFSMDYVEGTDLARLCAESPLPPRQAATYLRAVADAVHAAHERGVLHRDLKPANILIDRDDRPFVTDFGLAKHVSAGRGLTTTGRAMGTPAFMPPEQASGRWSDVTRASDVYSLGAVLYVMLTGHPPFRGTTELDTLLEVLHREPRPPTERRAGVDRELATICMKCLRKDISQRYATARELADDLDRYLRGEPIHARPRSRLRRAARWTIDIPIVAALSGRHVPLPTKAHRRAQAGIILAVIATVMTIVLGLRFRGESTASMPSQIVVAAGRPDGVYYSISERIAGPLAARTGRPVRVENTAGSQENQAELLAGRAHLGWLQAAALRGDELCVVAPAYYEYLHVIVRRAAGIHRMEDLAGATVGLGASKSGSRLTAESVLAQFHLTGRIEVRDHDWNEFLADPACDAAIFTVGLQSRGLGELLDSDQFELLPVRIAEEGVDRTLESARIPRSVYPRAIDSEEGLFTQRTPAFLVTTRSAPNELVTATLAALYALDLPGLISRDVAATWTFLPWHPATRSFYRDAQ